MEIYLDAVWLLNFLLDYMLLLLTARLARLNMRRYRVAFGAFVASLIVPVTVLYPESWIISIPGKMMFSIVIIMCSFGFHNFYRLMKLLALFYFMSFSIGGGMFAIHFFLQHPVTINELGYLTYHTGYGDTISWLLVLIGFPIVWIFTKLRMDMHVQDKIRYDAHLMVTIKLNGESQTTVGFIDSGNQLTDPFTKKPVIICDEVFLLQWFQESEWEQLEAAYHDLDMERIPENWLEKLRIIPYQGVEGKGRFMFTLQPDEMMIQYEGKEIRTTQFLIGIQFGKMTRDGSYHCLLQPELLQSANTYSA